MLLHYEGMWEKRRKKDKERKRDVMVTLKVRGVSSLSPSHRIPQGALQERERAREKERTRIKLRGKKDTGLLQ